MSQWFPLLRRHPFVSDSVSEANSSQIGSFFPFLHVSFFLHPGKLFISLNSLSGKKSFPARGFAKILTENEAVIRLGSYRSFIGRI